MNNDTNIIITWEKRILDVPHTPVDQVTFTNGNEMEHPYNIVRRKNAICILLITKNNKIITTEQFRIAIWQTLSELPAWQVEKNENHLDTVIKEVHEEVWYKVKPENISHITDIYSSSGFTDEKISLYLWTDAKFIGHKDAWEASENIQTIEFQEDEFVDRYINQIQNNQYKERKIDLILLRGAILWNTTCKRLLQKITKI